MVRTGLIPTPSTTSSTYRAPTTRDIPPVTLTNTPHVEPSAFKDYLSRIGPLFESFQRGRAEQGAQGRQQDAEAKKNEEGSPEGNGKRGSDASARPPAVRQLSAQTLSPVESPKTRRRSSAYGRRRANEPTSLSTIPNVYFDPDFHLENPRIFDVVSERAEIVRPAPGTAAEEKQANGNTLPPRKSLATNAILQEKLSWYMDTVEVHLINSISAASTSFFAALGSLRDLQHEASESVAKIQALRADLAALDKGMAMGGLEIARMRQKRENVNKLGQATAQVQLVVDRIVHCEDLVENGEYEDAADTIISIDRLIAGQPEPISKTGGKDQANGELQDQELIDLRDLKALQGLSGGMRQLQFRIGKGFETRFLEALLSDLRHHVDRVPPQDTMRRWASASQRTRGDHNRIPTGVPAYLETRPELRQDLLAALRGLTRSGHSAQATTAFRDSVMKEMKALIRKHLPSSSDDDTESITSVSTRAGRQISQQEKSAVLARNLRALDEKDSEDLLVNVYTNVSEALRRLSVQVKVLLDVTSSFDRRPSRASSPEPGMSPRSPQMQSLDATLKPPSRPGSPGPRLQEEMSQALDMSSLLGQAVDVAQTQITRVLKVRAEQTHRLPLERFLRYFTINRFFADECEAISGRSGQVLKNIVNTQLNAFVANMGETETQKIAQQLDSDQWEAKDFKEKDQEILSRILAGMNSDPAIWTRGTRVWEDPTPEPTNGALTTNGTKDDSSQPSAKTPAKPAYIDENRFILVQSAITLLPTLETFLALMTSIPSIASAAIPALAETLRTFNSRSSQLILGAGATRIAGLKNITTKHLALSSQALSFVIAMIPYMRESVRRHVAGKNELLAEFDKVKRLYQDHQMGIHDKLVEIMTSRANAHVNAMKKMDFDSAGQEEAKASPYMETLTKETGTLYRVLGRHLAEPDVLGIMALISTAYGEVWGRAFEDVVVRTQMGKNRLLVDAGLFESRLGKIQGFEVLAKELLGKVKAKTITVEGGKKEVTTSSDANDTKVEAKKEEEEEEKKS